ncbi:MAG TPA: hypothetical protein VG095_10040 [Chthoniobacterales bacterium]|nr:hypothetical protein [Chthoniobacterales bacterium]
MRRVLVVVLFAIAAALGIWFGRHWGSSKTSSAAVTALLPRETLAFLHIPDVNGARAKWRETDLYKLWREPAVQEFLQKPLANAPNVDNARARFDQLAPLHLKDVFFAITAWENQKATMLAGFRFRGEPEDAEKIIGGWRTRLEENAPAAKRETIEYEKHHIDVATHDAVTLATVYDGNWFFAANDLDALKELLDRADGRSKDGGPTLATDEEFIAGSRHMPAIYAARVYARVDRYIEKALSNLPPEQRGDQRAALLGQLGSISGAFAFDGGKMRDVLFVGMPKTTPEELKRSSLTLASRDTFLYLATFLQFPRGLPNMNSAPAGGVAFPARQFLGSLNTEAITAELWTAAFGPELGIIGEWAANSRVPFVFATLPIKDAARAAELVAAMTAGGEGAAWTKAESDAVQYYAQPPVSPMLPIAPSIALSKDRLVVGHDQPALQALMRRTSSDFSGTDVFRAAERAVPAGNTGFLYFDTALFYTRLDAAIRPMLVLAAAFMPSIAQTVDLGKLPPPEVITKHLSPIVMSQRYLDSGYVTESVGPISLFQGLAAVAAGTGVTAGLNANRLPALTQPSPAQPAPSPTQPPDEE